MPHLKEIYTDGWYKKRLEKNGRIEEAANIIVPSLYKRFSPASVIDFGCGACNFANKFKKAGTPIVVAVDGPSHSSKYSSPEVVSIVHDLKHPLVTGAKFDLVFCMEVAEHIEKKFADVFINSLIRHSTHNGYFAFTAAPPSQGGRHHVNCQPYEYWIKKFERRQCFFDDVLTKAIKNEWKNKITKATWYYRNLMIFQNLGMSNEI